MREWRWALANVYECTYCTKENICIKISVRLYTKTLQENVVLFDLFPSLTASQPTRWPWRNKEKKTKTKVVIKVLTKKQLADAWSERQKFNEFPSIDCFMTIRLFQNPELSKGVEG
jgi:hypothetical protein